MQDIVLLKSWWFNIGDGFVKLGAQHILEQIFGPERVVTSSALGANKFDMVGEGKADPAFPSLLDLASEKQEATVVLAGCVLNKKLNRIADKLELLSKKPRVVFLGAGGRGYDPETVSSVGDALRRLEPYLLIARDDPSLDYFGKFFTHARKGFDCAYWVSDAVPALSQRGDYTIRTFNRMVDPGGSTARVIRCEHSPFRLAIEPEYRAIKRNVWRIFRPRSVSRNHDAFISDDISEYLRLYSGAQEVHTDMVHATVAAASYGTAVKMYHRSARQGVLTSVIGEGVFEEVFTTDISELARRKAEELAEIKSILTQ